MKLLVRYFLLGQMMCFAQPFIFTRGISNSASSLPYAIPGGSIAQGSIFSIYGRNLGPPIGVQPASFPLDTTLKGVAVTVTSGSTHLNAYPLYVSANQVNAIMPSGAPLGAVSVRVVVNGTTSNAVPALVTTNSVGLFTVLGAGAGPGIVFNYVSSKSQPLNSLQTPAKPGQVVTMWGTGLGPVSADNVAPTAGNLPVKVQVYVGGKAAAASYAGRSPCCAGDDQIVFQVPLDSPTGCWVPVNVQLGGTTVSNTVTMAITSNGTACVPSGGPAKALVQGGNLGLVAPLRADINQSAPNSPLDLRTDFLVARFGAEKGGQFAFNPLISLPPPGTCTAYAGVGNWFNTANLPNLAPSVRALDAGGGTVTAGAKSAKYSFTYSPLTLGYLGSSNPTNTAAGDTTLLSPGAISAQIAGGADVSAFKAATTMISPLAWSNQSQIATVDRTEDLALTWTGGSGQTIAAVGGNVDVITNSSGIFVCIASPGSNSITVPATILANVPPGRGDPHYSRGAIFLVAAGATSTFSATGLNQGFALPLYLTEKAVVFQ